MAYPASNRFNYWSQLGILTGLCGVGLMLGGIVSFLPLINKISLKDMSGGGSAFMDKLLVPENASALRWMQFISTFFLFFLPPVIYGLVCHKKPFIHLGFKHSISLQQLLIVVAIMFVSLPLVNLMAELTHAIPWSKETLVKFKIAEDAYNKQVSVMARMNGTGDFISALIIVAFLPAIFEETLFRGAMQNLLSRWFKMPILALIISSAVFSAVHGSYDGFLTRFVLGFILGWMYYRTGNLWLSIICHFANNAFGVVAIYLTTKPGQKVDAGASLGGQMQWWTGIVSIALVIALFYVFEKVSKKDIDHPGEEVLIPGTAYSNNPFDEGIH